MKIEHVFQIYLIC